MDEEPIYELKNDTYIVRLNKVFSTAFLTSNNSTLSPFLHFENKKVITFKCIPNKNRTDFPKCKEEKVNCDLEIIFENYDIKPKKRKRLKLSKKEAYIRLLRLKKQKIIQMLKLKYTNEYIALKLNCKIKEIIYCKKKLSTKSILSLSRKNGKTSKISQKYIDNLKDLYKIKKNSFLSSKTMLEKWLKECDLPSNYIGERQFRNILHKKLGFTYKKNITTKPYGNSLKNLHKRRDFVLIMLKIIKKDWKVVFIDETGFNLSGHKKYGWHPKGKPISIDIPQKSINYSLIGAVTKDELIGFMVFKGSINTVLFLGFLLLLLKQIIRDEEKNLDKCIFILDNASIHRSFLNNFNLGLNVLWLPPYSPFLNPIELLWNLWKKKVYNKDGCKSEEDLILKLGIAAKEIKKKDLFGMFRHSLKKYEALLNLQEDLE